MEEKTDGANKKKLYFVDSEYFVHVFLFTKELKSCYL